MATVDISPIANGIRGIGSGLANLAIKKALLQSQADKNALAAELSQSQIDFNQSRTALNQQKYDALVPLFGQLAGMDLSDRDVRNEVAMLANGKAYLPYSNVGSTGATFSRATGDVAASPEGNPLLAAELAVRQSQVDRNNAAGAASMALKALNDVKAAAGGFAPRSSGTTGGGSISNVKPLYTDNVETPDPFMPGVMKVAPRTDFDRMRANMAALVSQGKSPYDTIAHLALMNAGASPAPAAAPAASPAVVPPAAAAAPSGDNVDLVQGRLGGSGIEAAVNNVLNQLRRGEITRAEAQAALTQLGVN